MGNLFFKIQTPERVFRFLKERKYNKIDLPLILQEINDQDAMSLVFYAHYVCEHDKKPENINLDFYFDLKAQLNLVFNEQNGVITRIQNELGRKYLYTIKDYFMQSKIICPTIEEYNKLFSSLFQPKV